MFALTISIVFAVAFGHVMRHAQERKRSMVWVAAVSYPVACALSIAAWAGVFRSVIGWQELVFGGLGGLAWFAAYLLMDTAIRLAGLSITQCVGWLGVVAPMFAAAVFFGETPTTSQYIGMALMALAMALLTVGKTSNVTSKSKWRVPVLLGLFLCEGAINMSVKWFEVSLKSSGLTQAQVDGRCSGLLIFLFGVAGLAMCILAISRSDKLSRGALLHGLSLGVVAFAANYAFVIAVNRLPAALMFPSFWAGVLLLASTSAVIFWKERYTKRAWTGMAMALLTMIFVSVDVEAWLRGLFP
ncbi:MAG: hypothetical protein KAI66_02085 [Lentisphaeria bacterium]|nr:hypothetical protein [Lentisphaeria bacterium]